MAHDLQKGDMSITQTTPQSTLKTLIQTLHDGQEGFRHAAENVQDPNLKAVFNRFSLQRSKLAGELQSEALALGVQDPQKEGTTFAGKLHRGWFDLKSAFISNDQYAILSEAERGEDVAVKAYQDALEQTNLPAPLRSIIGSQAVQIKLTHDEIKLLRDAAKIHR